MPPNPPSNAHGFAMRSMSLRDMQIQKSEKKILGPPPSQILGTPLLNRLTSATGGQPFMSRGTRGHKSTTTVYNFLKIIVMIIVVKEQYASLITDDLQFGFKENSSTIICTQLLIETIEYYNSNNTDCFMLLLDASKAFDRIEYSTLFNNLRNRNMCPVTLRLIMNSGVVVVERLERSLQFLFSRVERRSSSCFTCFLSILLISCRNYHLT